MKRNFFELLRAQWSVGKFLCVGLDPVQGKIEDMVAVVKATADIAAAYKPNPAFFLQEGLLGLSKLLGLMKTIHATAPSVPVIIDCKCGDRAPANLGYAKMWFDEFQADAITIHPIFGQEENEPFLCRSGKGIFVIARSSGPGAKEFQDLVVPGTQLQPYQNVPMSLSEAIAYQVTKNWNHNGNCGLVVGATTAEMVQKMRWKAGDMPLLMPGVGDQGGNLAGSVKVARIDQGGFLINVSGLICRAVSGPQGSIENARSVAIGFHEQILAVMG